MVLLGQVHGAVVEQVRIGVISVDEENLGNVSASRPALDMDDDIERIRDICFDGLSVIYHRDCEEIIGLFGVNFADAAKDQAMFGWPHTHPIGIAGGGDTDTIPFPVRARNEFQAESTQLITRLIQVWGDVPIALIRQLDIRKALYGYLGLNDFSLFPIVFTGIVSTDRPHRNKSQGRRLGACAGTADLLFRSS